MQLSIEDYIYAVGMSRIRHFYVEMVPQADRISVNEVLVRPTDQQDW